MMKGKGSSLVRRGGRHGATACVCLRVSSTSSSGSRRSPTGRRRVVARWPRVDLTVTRSSEKDDVSESDDQVDDETSGAEAFASTLANLVANPSTYLVAAVAVAGLASQFKPNTATIVVISALPVVGLTAISKTEVGENIANRVEEEKKELLPLATRSEAERMRVRETDPELRKYFGETRSKLSSSANHLTGVLPGDAGFDLLGLSRTIDPAAPSTSGSSPPASDANPSDSEDNAWRNGAYAGTRLGAFFEAELLHSRWAMLAAVGCLIPEALARYCGFDSIAEPVWWKVGYSVLHDGVDINYAGLQGFRIAGDKGLAAIAACQLVLMGGPEYARRVGIESLEPVGIFLPGCVNYPGGQLFDPLNLAKDPVYFTEQQVKEIKNGRLAMVAMLGYGVQAVVTGEGPLANLDKFLSDPLHENILAKMVA